MFIRVCLAVVLLVHIVLSKSTWHEHGIPSTCDVTVCSYVIIKNGLNLEDVDNTWMTNSTLELISGTSNGNPAAIPNTMEEMVFLKKAPFVALGVVGVLHYQINGYNATVINTIITKRIQLLFTLITLQQ